MLTDIMRFRTVISGIYWLIAVVSDISIVNGVF